MKLYLVVLSLLLLGACGSTKQETSLVLDYEEFGPPSAAFKILGNDWWQWDSHGDSRPKKYAIKVIVYKGINREALLEHYPIDQETEKDFRFIQYDVAITYLDELIKENTLPELTEKLKLTRAKLQNL